MQAKSQPPDRQRRIDAVKPSPRLHALPLSDLEPGEPLRHLTAADLPGLRQLPWHLVKIADSGRRLVVTVNLGGACSITGARAEEAPESVHLAIYGTCPTGVPVVATSRHAVAAVQLTEPLGQRQLLGAGHDATPRDPGTP